MIEMADKKELEKRIAELEMEYDEDCDEEYE